MSDYSTISLKKSFIQSKEVQQWMEKQGFDSTSEAARAAIRIQAHQQGNATQRILQEVLAKADLNELFFPSDRMLSVAERALYGIH